MAQIRPYKETDKRKVQEICLRTANDDYPFTTIEERPFKDYLLGVYCDYYIEQEPKNCFVVTNEADEAVGYIMCAGQHRAYQKCFMKEYLPRIKNCSLKDRLEARGEVLLHGVFSGRYPAHLHIDILRDYRGGGNGTGLMNELLSHLKKEGVKGVHLIVSADNTKAVRFYERCGFVKVLSFGKGIVMGKKIL